MSVRCHCIQGYKRKGYKASLFLFALGCSNNITVLFSSNKMLLRQANCLISHNHMAPASHMTKYINFFSSLFKAICICMNIIVSFSSFVSFAVLYINIYFTLKNSKLVYFKVPPIYSRLLYHFAFQEATHK